MAEQSKKCPMCAERILLEATVCEYCGAQFKVTRTGYCQNCHEIRDADEKGRCQVCGQEVTDWRVESKFVETTVSIPDAVLPAPSKAPAASHPPQRKPSGTRAIVAAIVLGLCGLLVVTGVGIAGVTLVRGGLVAPEPTDAVAPTPTSAPDIVATGQLPTATAQPVLAGTIMFWYAYEPGSTSEDALLTVIRNAETAYPGLDVIASNHFGTTNLFEAYKATVYNGGTPDLILFDNDDYLGDLVRAGLALPMDSLPRDELSGFKQYALDGWTVDGKLYGLPQSVNVVALYYKKSEIAEPPLTTDDLLVLQQEGQSLVVPHFGPYWLYGFWGAFGGQLMDDSGFCTANQGGFVPALEYVLDLQRAGAQFQFEYDEAQEQFLDGNAAMLINGPWALSQYEETLGSDLRVVPLPAGSDGPSRPLISIGGFFINPDSPKAKIAVSLAMFMTSRESAQVFTDEGQLVPARNDVSVSNPLLSAFSLASAAGLVRPHNEEMNSYWDPFNTMFDEVLAGEVTPQAAVQRACDKMNELNQLP